MQKTKTPTHTTDLPPYEVATVAALEDLKAARAAAAHARAQASSADGQVAQLTDLARALIAQLPKELQAKYLPLLGAKNASASSPMARAGETLSNVVQLFSAKEKQVWTAAEVQSKFSDRFGPVDPKAIYNALNYLERLGRLRRIGRGRYLDMEHGLGFVSTYDTAATGPEKGGIMED